MPLALVFRDDVFAGPVGAGAADPRDVLAHAFVQDDRRAGHVSDAKGAAFGPWSGHVLCGLGDGGGANDGLADTPPSHGPIDNAQIINAFLGKVLRIDVDGPPQAPLAYAIPADNPFVGVDGLDEIYAYGLRNPFRFAFDDGPGGDGRLVLADVGQNLFEEVDIIHKGGNYGWVIREGLSCFDPFQPNTPPATCSTAAPSSPRTYTQGREIAGDTANRYSPAGRVR